MEKHNSKLTIETLQKIAKAAVDIQPKKGSQILSITIDKKVVDCGIRILISSSAFKKIFPASSRSLSISDKSEYYRYYAEIENAEIVAYELAKEAPLA